MSFKDRKRDDHGHVIGNDEVDGQKCQHVNGGSSKPEFDDDYDEEFNAADEEYNREMKKAQEENAKKALEAKEFDEDEYKLELGNNNTHKITKNGELVREINTTNKDDAEQEFEDFKKEVENEFDEEPKDDLMNPKNPKYEGFKRSDITNAKVIDKGKKIHNYDKDEDETLSIIEYIPYGALQDGDNRKLYGVVKNYDGSDAPKIGAIVSPDLKSAQEDLKSQIELAEQGSERYLKRGKWDEEFFNIINDKEYDFDDDTKKKYSEKYGWDFSKPWNEQEHVKKGK